MASPIPSSDPPPFDLTAEMPNGTTLLVASAGTGKTYAIAALTSRFVAMEGIPLTDMLLITFTRAATRELRERIRTRLIWTRDTLSDLAAARGHGDPVIRLLAQGSDAQVAERRDRLVEALATFDSATIATTHEFCSEMLASLGVGADTDPVETFVEDLSELCAEVADDIYVRQFTGPAADDPTQLPYDTAMKIAKGVIEDPIASLDAGPASAGSPAAARQRFGLAVRTEVEQRRRQRSLVSYADQVGRLAAALRAEGAAESNRQRLRDRYRLVMVDEFQDTDALQWQILADAFCGQRDLILIGDPKQAIYGFRGGDVFTYLHAASVVDQRATMTDNWRSDAELVGDINRLFGGVALGHDEIRVSSVRARHSGRLSGAPVPAGLRLRMVGEDAPGTVGELRKLVAHDVAADISELLASGATLDTGPADHARPLSAGDIAVLSSSWREAELVRKALSDAGVHSVLTGADSVFASTAAKAWLALLRAVERPQVQRNLRAAMITPLIGISGEALVHRGDELADRAAAMMRGWAVTLVSRGVAAMAAEIVEDTDLYARLLALPDGERTITDLMHVAELLHAQRRAGGGVSALIAWLDNQIKAAGAGGEEARRRMETDAPAVQLLTVHGSKGLEFPVVYVPFLWSKWSPSGQCAVVFHRGHDRLIDVRGDSAEASWKASVATAKREEAGEDLRELYVALTRASCQAVAWWAPSRNTPPAPLHRLLAARIAGTPACEQQYPVSRVDPGSIAGLGLHVERVDDRTPVPPVAPGNVPLPGDLAAAPFDRTLDTTWRRTSYSGLTLAAHEAAYEQERLTGERDDEPAAAEDEMAAGEPGDTVTRVSGPGAELRSPMAELPKGATFGTLVHHVLEIMQTGGDVAAELHRCSTEALAHRPLSGVAATQLASALEPAVTTPLGPLADNLTLWQIGRRLTELDFELPLALHGGSRAAASPPGERYPREKTLGPGAADRPKRAAGVTMAELAELMRQHLPEGDPFVEYPDRLEADGITATRLLGYLAGSIDAVLRVGDPERPRFLVVDYKTNWLGPADTGELTAASYTPAAMAAEMLHAHYPLQALLYCVALHRYLRWRMPGYEPAAHFGGVQYLFVRGMCGPQTPVAGDGTPYGVFSWQPGAALVSALSDRLKGRGS